MQMDWAALFYKIRIAIEDAFLIKTDTSCGTHIHISPKAGWMIPEARSLAKATIYYEKVVGSLFPIHRAGRAAIWCKSNQRSAILNQYRKAKDGPGMLSVLDNVNTLGGIALTMCGTGGDDSSPSFKYSFTKFQKGSNNSMETSHLHTLLFSSCRHTRTPSLAPSSSPPVARVMTTILFLLLLL